MPTTKNNGSKIEASPLLHKDSETSHSTINPSKLNKARFSEIKEMESEGNSVRIILYVLIVIAVGVGLALLVRQLISSQQASPTPNQQANQNENEVENTPDSAFVVTENVQMDSLASNPPSNEDFIDSELVSLGSSSVDMTSTSLDTITYTDYTSFTRLEFDLTTDDLRLPKTNVTFSSADMTLQVEFVGLEDIEEELMNNKSINSLVTEVRFDETKNIFTIELSEASKYRALAAGDSLVLDIKSVEAIEAEDETPVEEEPVDTPVVNPPTTGTTNPPTTTPSNPNKPVAPHYDNEFSQNTQYVSSSVTGKAIGLNNYYVWDQGTFFEFSWAEEKKVGDDYIPNAVAYLETEGAKNYIVVEIENLSRSNLEAGLTSEQVGTKAGITMAGANFVSLKRDSYDANAGKAVYRIELKKKADFKLLSQQTYDKKTQILSIQIKD